MKTFTVTKSVSIDYGHRVPNHSSKCANVHGHRGKVEVTVMGPLCVAGSSEDMVIDFGAIKEALESEIVDKFDHKFIMSNKDTGLRNILLASLIPGDGRGNNRNSIGAVYYIEDFGHVQEIPGIPTAENLAYICFTLLSRRLNTTCTIVTRVSFWETPTSVATYDLDEAVLSTWTPGQLRLLFED